MNWTDVTRLSLQEQRDLQNRKLKRFFRHALPFSPYYRDLFKRHDLSFSEFQTTDDLVKLPFTTKEDLAPTEEERARPRAFILQPDERLLKQYATKGTLLKLLGMKLAGRDPKPMLEREFKPLHLHFTTGRTALPTPFAYSARDLETLRETGMRLLNVSGVSSADIGINAFPYSPHLAFWLTYYAMVRVGMMGLPTGGGKVMGTLKILDSLERLKGSLLTVIPGYCYHMLRQAVAERRDLSALKTIIFGGERVSPGLRGKVKELLAQCGAKDVRILATYAMTEAKTAWLQCSETSGYHLYPDLEYFEVVDEEGRRVKDGERGQLVYTALDWRGSTVVRYKTGDLTDGIEYGACPHCGRTVPRIRPDLQRSSDMKEFRLTKVKGELVNLNNFFPLLSSQQDVEEWQVVVRKKNGDPYEIDEIVVRVAPRAGAAFDPAALKKKVEEGVNVGVDIEVAPLQDILHDLGMETELKEKRIVDARPRT